MQNREVRLANLRHLIKREGAVSQLALRLQISPIYIYRVLDGKFNIGDSMARKIEDAYGFVSSWMDIDHGHDEEFAPDVPTLVSAEPDAIRSVNNGPRGPAVSSDPLEEAVPSAFAGHEQQVQPSSSPLPLGEGAFAGRADVYERLVVSLTNTVDRMLDAHGVDLSVSDKARLIMQVAQRILDNGKMGNAPTAASHAGGSLPPRPVLKISEG